MQWLSTRIKANLAISEKEYLSANDDEAFVPPINPALTPSDPTVGIWTHATAQNDINTLPFTAAEAIRIFNFYQQEYIKYESTIAALRNLILNAIDDNYMNEFKYDRTKYALVNP